MFLTKMMNKLFLFLLKTKLSIFLKEELIDDSKKFPGLDYMKSFSLRNLELHKVPSPINCIIEMINIQLKVNKFLLKFFFSAII